MASIEPKPFTQEELNDLIRDLDLPNESAEILASRLREKKLLASGTKVTVYHTRDQGGTCRERTAPSADGEVFDCECHARFAGRRCELDSDPCASQPCLHGGECTSALQPPGYVCACAAGLRGARCELGRWCGSSTMADGDSVCAHGGLCEEGEWGPSCRCHGYYGPLCQAKLKISRQCSPNPKAHWHTEGNSLQILVFVTRFILAAAIASLLHARFRCECSALSVTTLLLYDVDECAGEPCLNGATCINEPGSFRCLCPPDRTGMNCGNPLYSDAVVAGDAAGFWDGALRWARAAAWPFWAGIAAALLAVLSLTVLLLVICRRRRRPPPATPAHKESLLNSDAPNPAPDIKRASKLSNIEAQRERRGATTGGRSSPYRAPLNNMDTLRSYGSAGDELELMPPDYLRNLNMPAASADKPWSEQMHLRTFTDNKIYNDLKGTNTNKRGTLPGLLDNRLRACGRAPSPPALDPHLLGGYHWDVSDWGAAALGAAISEVAGSERPDSSEAPSEGRAPNSERSDTTHTRGSGRLRGADVSSGEDERYGRVAAYALHPDAYLPRAAADTDSDGAASGTRMLARNRLRRADAASLITMLEERSSLLGDSDEGVEGEGDAASCSSLSANVCDIEESDAEEPLRMQGAPLTTDV
ncbi:Fat-like cadherin-related tumor suppressor homolog [Eumeta japonica]|uniref:Fat-like cadherin-related tumor suppressor homolog n=1 Tax=Eumeta variegata TaxID=151549 RepID=A0A4C1Z3A0_EUMVA|nr:Fat-like cadherin-related tumor suppressor homolog [Eumeta japonica]